MKKYNVKVNGVVYEVEIEESGATVASSPAVSAPAPKASPAAPAPAPSAPQDGVKIVAPMPGTILGVKVNVGDSVKKGQCVVVLEAMKMENEIPATTDGVVKSVEVKKGDSVNTDAVLVILG